ncbi:hypothetical protein O181_057845 [Austropuccinia psidii MF-1]|uniref:Uncharacterized protein n=1 Tax=Austropuccinia psidii MF-1 TaxID=1389203 RepID=A0A9Q3E8J9_9BASI|nr:hypothetical protein [Austropuccinia psidii MF-1]
MRNHKLLEKLPGDLGNAVRFRFRKEFNMDNAANILQEVWEGTSIGRYTEYKINTFRDKHRFVMDPKDRSRDKWVEISKKRNLSQNCGSSDHFAKSSPKTNKIIYSRDEEG